MREILDAVVRWKSDGRRVVIGRVVALDGSGPRDPGAAMAVAEDGEVAGSVSGGCVEGAVVESALALLAGSQPAGVVSFGYSDDDAFAVGLTCGGTIHVLLYEFERPAPGLVDARRGEQPIALATRASGAAVGAELLVGPDGARSGSLGDDELDRIVTRDAVAALDGGAAALRHYGPHGEAKRDDVSVFIEPFVAPARMIILGAVDFSAALARAAKLIGFRVVVADARAPFATEIRFPMADEVVVDWPDRVLRSIDPPLGGRDAVCVLTHDLKFDVPAIAAALDTHVGYVGAMGSRRTAAARLEALRAAGLGDAELARLHAPIGLDLGARTPEEVAVAICAEVIATRTGRDVPRLRDGSGPIHV